MGLNNDIGLKQSQNSENDQGHTHTKNSQE